jgi:hypothetical protein
MKLLSSAFLLILFLAACVHMPVAQTPPVTTAGNSLVVFETSGGFAGVDQVLTVFKDGKLEFTDNRRNQHREARVKPEQIAKLQELISKPEYEQLQLSNLPHRGADYFIYKISTWTSDGKERTVTATDLDLPNILSQVISELNTLRRLIP